MMVLKRTVLSIFAVCLLLNAAPVLACYGDKDSKKQCDKKSDCKKCERNKNESLTKDDAAESTTCAKKDEKCDKCSKGDKE